MSSKLNKPLKGVNLVAGDVTADYGPYLAICLLAHLHRPHWHWFRSCSRIDVADMARTPAGALIERTHRNRGLPVACVTAVGAAALGLVFTDEKVAIFGAQATMVVALAFLGPLR